MTTTISTSLFGTDFLNSTLISGSTTAREPSRSPQRTNSPYRSNKVPGDSFHPPIREQLWLSGFRDWRQTHATSGYSLLLHPAGNCSLLPEFSRRGIIPTHPIYEVLQLHRSVSSLFAVR